MTHEQWLQTGIDNGWITASCLMHKDLELYTEQERHRYLIDGEDPCIPRYIVNPQT